jgi:hypothetical protein
VALSQDDKHSVIFEHFLQHLGSYTPRSCKLNLANLGWQPRPLLHLDEEVLEAELESVIIEAPKEKAPGLDGFKGMFFSSYWGIIKEDIKPAVNHFLALNQQSLHLLNQAYIVLITKKGSPQRVANYMPISLIHSFAKIASMILANRLGPELKHLISHNQTTFIQGRYIHDSFAYVQGVVNLLHKKQIPTFFIKLDISKAFDTVSWPYLLDIMSYLGFGPRWREWIFALWGTTSSIILLNGEPDKRILHCRGGGGEAGRPLSPKLFLLAIEPLHLLFYKAQQSWLLKKFSAGNNILGASLYADDAALFIHPAKRELKITDFILHLFVAASGLNTNMSKTMYFPLHCQDINLDFLA